MVFLYVWRDTKKMVHGNSDYTVLCVCVCVCVFTILHVFINYFNNKSLICVVNILELKIVTTFWWAIIAKMRRSLTFEQHLSRHQYICTFLSHRQALKKCTSNHLLSVFKQIVRFCYRKGELHWTSNSLF